MQRHRGPLPDPQQLVEYENVLPGAADRIIAMAEREQRHRHDLQQAGLKQRFAITRNGQRSGLTALAIMAALAAYLGNIGHPGWAVVAGSLDIVAVVTIFVVGKRLGGDAPTDRASAENRDGAEQRTPERPEEEAPQLPQQRTDGVAPDSDGGSEA
ncbi:DUF2335 domain-containing protein [Streptomyces sp. NPDC005463]|uniref:DUF2335 domain-containing protein n=1 Tax=Streptomyces sp. NPDC005463 TaxID=3154465 RepID=UPI0033B30C36